MNDAELIIIGAGAAGLAAGIFAGEAAAARGRPARILLLDGARKPGAKILVSGGGRCNVTHARVTPEDYQGGPRPLIRSVLRAFGEEATVAWMRRLGVELKLEATGKYFPVSNQAGTVLEALLGRLEELGARLAAGVRVATLEREAGGFLIRTTGGETLRAPRVVVATGGLALPKSGSDGAGLEMLRALGHEIIPPTPALVPLVLAAGREPGGRFAELAGLTTETRLGLYDGAGRCHAETTGSLLFTHFGVSGPCAMDFSRHWLRARLERPEEKWLVALGHPKLATSEAAEGWLRRQAALAPRRPVAMALGELYPNRLAALLAEGLSEFSRLTRAERLMLARRLARLPLPVVADRGWAFAETTAGGVNLRQVDPRTMQSRLVPGLYIIGEVLDVDGRIGGFSFQWAWSSAWVAARAAME